MIKYKYLYETYLPLLKPMQNNKIEVPPEKDGFPISVSIRIH